MAQAKILYVKSVNGVIWYVGLTPTNPGMGRCSELGSYFHRFSMHKDNKAVAARFAQCYGDGYTAVICDVLRPTEVPAYLRAAS
jgi:hypothetical protein